MKEFNFKIYKSWNKKKRIKYLENIIKEEILKRCFYDFDL